MKKKYLFVLMLMSGLAMAGDFYKIPVIDMSDAEMQGTWNLTHQMDFGRVVLDCQSFLHGIYIHEKEEKKFFYLYEPECYEIYDFVAKGLENEKSNCLELDFSSSEFYLSREPGSCD